MATIVLPAQDCEPLRNADERKIVEVLTHRSCEQRQEIRKIYSQMYNEDFCDRIKRKCNKKVQKALLLWMLSPAERDAEIVREALKGQYSTNYKALMEITCSRSSTELLGIRQMYHSKFKKSIEEDIATETSMGNVQRLLLSLASAYRYEGPELDGETAMREARELREAIMNMGDSKGLDEEGAYVFTRVLGTRSVAQLQATLNCYKQKYGQEISRDLEKECGGELEDAIRTCVECFYRPSRYYAQLLYEAMKGVGADDLTLIRVITTRAEVDMESIKAEFHGLYHKSLAQAIRSEQAMANPLKSFFLVVVDATRDGAVKAATKMPSQKMQNA